MNFVGKTIEIRYSSGLEVRARYDSTTAMTWEALSGPAKGRQGTEIIAAAEVAADVYFISWIEASGTSVSNVVDLGARTVHAYVTFQASEGRQGYLDHGTIVSLAP
ncbi:MAG TPA: phenolic acid decarboxylase [Steroidobacteraceae bacterium]|jgi:phenolic acid decarboxylase